jgi:hypothetical protein
LKTSDYQCVSEATQIDPVSSGPRLGQTGGQVIRTKQLVKSIFYHWISSIRGQRPWPDGQPLVTQGFTGESITEPIGDVGAPLVSVTMPEFNACRINRAFL